MEINFDNNVDSDNEIPVCNFVMLKVLKLLGQNDKERMKGTFI